MIRRLVCLLLVSSMFANQGLCFAHAHQGADIEEPEGHASRPHFHTGGHVHHHSTHSHDHHANHSHGHRGINVTESDENGDTQLQAILPVGQHDSDALYCGESVTLARNGNSVTVLAEKDVSTAVLLRVSNLGDGLLRLGPLRGQPPAVFEAACPIYLRTLSMRL
jgi:hypothetical protein